MSGAARLMRLTRREAICEAVTRPTMRFVPIKSVEQQAAGMLLRTRELLIRQRSQLANAFRAQMSELGIITALGMVSVAKLADKARYPQMPMPALGATLGWPFTQIRCDVWLRN
jgi:transposase